MINWRSNYAFALYRDNESRWSEARLILVESADVA